MKTFTPSPLRLVVSLLPCIAFIFTVQTTPAASTDFIHSPIPHSLYSNSAFEPESLPHSATVATALFPLIHKSPCPIDSSLSRFVDHRAHTLHRLTLFSSFSVKHGLKRRAPEDNSTLPGDNNSNDTITSARTDGTTTIAKEEEEAEAAQKAAEEARAVEEAAQKKAEEEEAARKKAEEEEAARKKAEEEEAARKKAEEEEAARKKVEEEETAKKKAEEEEAAREAAEEEAAKKAAEEETKKAGEEEAAKKAAEETEAAKRAKEEADRKAAVEEAARKAKEEAEKNKDKDKEHNKGTAHDKHNEEEVGVDRDNGTPVSFKDGTTTKGDSTESSRTTIMITAIAGGAALVAIVIVGFIIRHRRDVSRRASAMEAYLSKKVQLQPMDNDNDDTSTLFSRNNSNNGGNNAQEVYSHRSNSRHERSQQHLAHPSPRHQHVNQDYDSHHNDDKDISMPSMPTLMTTAAGVETSGRYYPQYHYEDYRAVNPVFVQSNLAPQDQYQKYCQQQGHDYYSHPQESYNEYYDQNIRQSNEFLVHLQFVDFPLPPTVAPPLAPFAIDTLSKEPSSTTAAPPSAAVSASLISHLPRSPHSLTCAKGSLKRSPVVALIASETGEGANGERSLRRSGSVLFE
ncbi:hypothetical protein BKA57DRAFT_496263 [Linnemannia elongata]|nr:hypothetical protein BKA57DRAFT_496263 [Linnemannia elongata]